MSSKHATTVADTPRRRWLPISVIVLLAVACGMLLVGSVFTPPKVSRVVYDSSDLVNRAGEAVVLVANERLAKVDAEQISVSPATKFTMQAQANEILIRFTAPLQYGQQYKITVRNVRSEFTRAAATLRATLTTPNATLTTLHRSAGRSRDQIDAVTIGSAKVSIRRVVWQAPYIQSFATMPSATLVVTRVNSRSALTLVTDKGQHQAISLPSGTQTVSELRANVTAHRFGFVVTTSSEKGVARLYTLDAVARDPKPTLAPGFGKQAIAIADWRFVPGTALLLVQSTQGQLAIVNPSGGAPKPLGLINEIGQFIPGTLSVTVSKGTSERILDLTNGKFTKLATTSTDSADQYASTSIVLDQNDTTLQLFVGLQQGDVTTQIVRFVQGNKRVLVDDKGTTSRARDLCASPNGEFVAVESVPADATSDNDAINPGIQGAKQTILATSTGAALGSIAGFDPSWCR